MLIVKPRHYSVYLNKVLWKAYWNKIMKCNHKKKHSVLDYIEVKTCLLKTTIKWIKWPLDWGGIYCGTHLHMCAQLCLTLCDPTDCSPPGSSVHGIFPGKNTGMDCHLLHQGIFLTQGSNKSLHTENSYPEYIQNSYKSVRDNSVWKIDKVAEYMFNKKGYSNNQ